MIEYALLLSRRFIPCRSAVVIADGGVQRFSVQLLVPGFCPRPLPLFPVSLIAGSFYAFLIGIAAQTIPQQFDSSFDAADCRRRYLWSGRADLNCRPPGPKPGALPLGHAPG